MLATALVPVDKIDPGQAWQPWAPGPSDPWSLKWAGHLYRRAAFGATWAELREAVRAGHSATLDRLLRGDPAAASRDRLLAASGVRIAPANDVAQLRAWWLYAILHSGHPLREKMTLFWHNHFATSIAKVQRTVLMYDQNQLLRRHALGKFRPMLLDVSRDPAMLLWLDSNSNVKGKPNENYARELMELFSLGVGHYTERDVREAARAFTGWHTEDDKFEFEVDEHDAGIKTVLGRTGNLNGEDIVGILLGQPAAARFLVRKLYRYFISEEASAPDALLEPLADAFRKSDYDIGAVVKTILASRHFYSAHAYRQRVKSPVEFMVGAVRALWNGPATPTILAAGLEGMGEDLFAPPNVKGWAGGKSWLTTATLVARHRFAEEAAAAKTQPVAGRPNVAAQPLDLAVPAPPKPPDMPVPDVNRDPAALVKQEKITEPARMVDFFADLLLQGGIPPSARAKLVAFAAEGKPTGLRFDQRVRETAHAILTMPEYQLA
jgi:uncharacterized protein (DUF1800 family)